VHRTIIARAALGLALLLLPAMPAHAADLDVTGRDPNSGGPPSSNQTVSTNAYYEAICVNPADQREIRWVRVTHSIADAVCRNTNTGTQSPNPVRFTCASALAQPTVWVYDAYDADGQRYKGVGGITCLVHDDPGD
jgi:hypothetical protein